MALSNMEEHDRQCIAPSAATGSNLILIKCKFTLEDVSEGAFIKILYKTSAMFLVPLHLSSTFLKHQPLVWH